MNDNLTKKQIILIWATFIVMMGSLIYGFVVLEVGQINNCWSKYDTEQLAILNCEGKQ